MKPAREYKILCALVTGVMEDELEKTTVKALINGAKQETEKFNKRHKKVLSSPLTEYELLELYLTFMFGKLSREQLTALETKIERLRFRID